MYALTPEHRKLKSMIQIIDILKNKKSQIIFYITPIDYQTGNYYLGEQFQQRVSQNIRLITSILNEKYIDVVDLSFDVNTDLFTWGKDPNDHLYPNEHLREQGRQQIAEHLVKKISKILVTASSTNQ